VTLGIVRIKVFVGWYDFADVHLNQNRGIGLIIFKPITLGIGAS